MAEMEPVAQEKRPSEDENILEDVEKQLKKKLQILKKENPNNHI